MRRSLRTAALAAATVLAAAAPAAAHVTVQPSEAVQGSYAKLAFRVPNERDDAATVSLEVQLPAAIEGARLKPLQGWEASLDGDTITWSGGRIEPGQFQEFEIAVGPLPEDADELPFKALQTYDDGDVVRWIETAGEGEAEPEHPAPLLRLTAADAADGGGGTSGATDADAAPGSRAEDEDDDEGSDGAVVGAYVVAGLALVVAAAALALARRRPRD